MNQNDYAAQISRMAEEQAQTCGEMHGIPLDFSPDSLERLDKFVAANEPGNAPPDSTITGYGMYVGETIRRNLGGHWAEDEQFGVHLKQIGDVNVQTMPLNWVRLAYEKGAEESIFAKFKQLAKQIAGGAVPEGAVAFAGTRNRSAESDVEEILIQSPAIIYYMVAAADGDVDDHEWIEFQEMMDDYHDFSSELFRRAVTAMLPKLNMYFGYLASPDFRSREALESIRDTLALNYPENEAREFKNELVDLGRKIAEASGGFLGFGDKVSEEENTVLTEITSVLGVRGRVD